MKAVVKGGALAVVDGLRRFDGPLSRTLQRVRAKRLFWTMQVLARWHGATVEIDGGLRLRCGQRVKVKVQPGSRNVVRLGPECYFGDDVLILLKGGTIDFGERVEVRRGTVLNLAGTLSLAGENILSWSNVVHCAERISLGRLTSTNEWVTLVDSAHYFTEPDAFVYHNTETGPIEIGENTWICAKSTVTRHARIGSHCIVAANSLVLGRVPSGHLAAGVPAKVVRKLPLPWYPSARQRAVGQA